VRLGLIAIPFRLIEVGNVYFVLFLVKMTSEDFCGDISKPLDKRCKESRFAEDSIIFKDFLRSSDLL